MNEVSYVIGVGCDAQPIVVTHYIDEATEPESDSSDGENI